MPKRDWKRVAPTSLRHALELCKEHARERRNLSVEGIAAHMGLTDHWTVYKWVQNGRIPAPMIRPFEDVTGIDFVTRWLAASAGRLLIQIPTGRNVTASDITELQALLNQAVGSLLDFHAGKTAAGATLASVEQAMAGLAWHRGTVTKHMQPELELAQ